MLQTIRCASFQKATKSAEWEKTAKHIRKRAPGRNPSNKNKKHIKAHKNILSACSPVFKDIVELEQQETCILAYLIYYY